MARVHDSRLISVSRSSFLFLFVALRGDIFAIPSELKCRARDSSVRLFVKRHPLKTYNHFCYSLRSNNEALYPPIGSSVFSFPGSHFRLAFIANFNEERFTDKVEILAVVEYLIGKYIYVRHSWKQFIRKFIREFI